MRLKPILIEIDRIQLKFRVEDFGGKELGRAFDMESAIKIFKDRYPHSSDTDAKPFIYEIVAFVTKK